MTSTVSLKISGLSALNVAAINETLTALLIRPGVVSIDTTKTTAVFEVTEPDAAASAVEYVAANLPGRGHPRASLHAVRRKLETASQWFKSAQAVKPEPQSQPVEWERTLMEDRSEPEPSSWVLEGTDDNAPDDEVTQRPEPVSVTVSVSDTAALIRTLSAAGLTVSVRRFPGSNQISYIHADRHAVSFTFRAPNSNERTPAQTAEFVKIDAESYRYLADAIAETMTDPDQWDGDEAEPYILVQYVKWLSKGKPVDEDGYPDKREDAAAGKPDLSAALSLVRSAFELADGRLYSADDFNLSEHGTLERVRDGLAQALAALTGRREPERESTVHVHFFPLPPNASTDPAMEPGDCECGRTFAEQMADPDSQTQHHPVYNPRPDESDSVIEMDAVSAYPVAIPQPTAPRFQARYPAGTKLPSLIDTTKPRGNPWVCSEDGFRLEFPTLEDAEAFAVKLNSGETALIDVCRYATAHTWNGVPAVTVLDCGPVGQVPVCQQCADFATRMS